MLYDFLKLSFDEMVEEYPKAESVSRERKAISFTDGNQLNTYSNNSDVVIYYDCIKTETPLLVVERIADEEVKSSEDLDVFISKLNEMYPDYVTYYDIVGDKEYIDLTVVKRNIYEAMQNAKG